MDWLKNGAHAGWPGRESSTWIPCSTLRWSSSGGTATADTSLDGLSRATRLNRSSGYSSFKDSLYLRCLNATPSAMEKGMTRRFPPVRPGPLRATQSFFEVTLQRIADPDVPDGCLVYIAPVQDVLASAARALLPYSSAQPRASNVVGTQAGR